MRSLCELTYSDETSSLKLKHDVPRQDQLQTAKTRSMRPRPSCKTKTVDFETKTKLEGDEDFCTDRGLFVWELIPFVSLWAGQG